MKVQFSSLSYYQNWKTKLVHFIIIPFINLILLVSVNSQYDQSFSWNIAIGTIVLNGGILSMSTMVELFTMDRILKIDREMAVSRPYSAKYWLNKVSVSIICGLTSIIINNSILLLFGAPISIIYRAFLIALPFTISGVILGFVESIAAWNISNTYLYLNIIEPMMVIVSGVLVNIYDYPRWLIIISQFFPFHNSISYIRNRDSLGLSDYLVDIIWLIIGITLYIKNIKKIKNNNEYSF